MQVSKIIRRGLTIEESQIYIMRGETPSHQIDLFESKALMMLRIFSCENVIERRLCGVLDGKCNRKEATWCP